jgi:anthranilate phosphoribosyltransferase
MFREYLQKIVTGTDLTEAEMAAAFDLIFSGDLTDVQIGALMTALAAKGETFAELAGAARAMRRKATKIQAIGGTVVDTCGTGGDGAQTFNISTTTAFVVAGCGVPVAKHGNRSVSSRCGSADLLEALGVKIDTPPEVVEEAVAEIGIGFLFAPIYHGAMRYAARARKEIGLRSIFNMLGPLTNPAGTRHQLLGVYRKSLTEMFAAALRLLGARRAMVVHGHDGLDEISVCASTRVTELKDEIIKTYDIGPEPYFGEIAEPAALTGGDVSENRRITRAVLSGKERGPKRNIVLFNAAAALVAAGKAADLQAGVKAAEASIDTGGAGEKLEALIRFTRENG